MDQGHCYRKDEGTFYSLQIHFCQAKMQREYCGYSLAFLNTFLALVAHYIHSGAVSPERI